MGREWPRVQRLQARGARGPRRDAINLQHVRALDVALRMCARSTSRCAAPPSTCSMCARSTSLCTWPVLDDGVGAVRQLLLCPKHKLLLHQQDNVYNIQTLRLAVLHKLNSYRVSALEIKSL